jgi:PhnB protein
MSKIQLIPYVNFQSRAREALELYQQVLGGTLDLYATDEKGTAKPAGPDERISHGRLDADGAVIFVSDGHPSFPPNVGDNMAIALAGTDKDRLTRAFSGLAEGGRIKMPLKEQAGGSEVGWLTDKFGINWMVTIDKA